jgi:LacI family fructose operon transcriptional repressor
MASIKDVARQAGVSTTTVSRVLGDSDAVRPALRERVQRAIVELAYRPNLAARRLRQQRASMVGLIVSDIRNPFFTEISRAVEDMAFCHDLRLILCNTDEDPAKEQAYLELMADEQASGVILSATLERLQRTAADDLPFPVVLIDRAPDPAGPRARCDVVQIDNTGAARRLTQHLLGQGHRRFVVLAGSRSSTGRERQAGIEGLLREHGLQPYVMALPPTAAAAQDAVRSLLAAGERPDALLATSGLLLLGAVQALQAAGLAWPQDIALAGFDNNEWTALLRPGITVIAQPTQEMGRSAGELLLQRIAEPDRAPRRIVLDGELLVRGSSGPRPA